MARKPRRREPDDEGDTPFGEANDARARSALRAYRCAVYSLIPIAGLLLGLIAVILGVMVWREGERDPNGKESGYIRTAVGLGLVTLLFNAAGVVLIVMALTAP
jgi:hypothetical protein